MRKWIPANTAYKMDGYSLYFLCRYPISRDTGSPYMIKTGKIYMKYIVKSNKLILYSPLKKIKLRGNVKVKNSDDMAKVKINMVILFFIMETTYVLVFFE